MTSDTWHDIKEFMPAARQAVLVKGHCVYGPFVAVAAYHPSEANWLFIDTRHNRDSFVHPHGVTHWCEIPAGRARSEESDDD